MPALHLFDYAAIGACFLILLWVGYRVMRAQQVGRESESFMGGGSAIVWKLAGEPWGFAASWAGWAVSLPVLVAVSLATGHGPDENPGLFA